MFHARTFVGLNEFGKFSRPSSAAKGRPESARRRALSPETTVQSPPSLRSRALSPEPKDAAPETDETEEPRKRQSRPASRTMKWEGRPRDAATIAKVQASCCDVRHPAGVVLNASGFWATTGLYPQAAVVSFQYALRLLELDLVASSAIEHLTVSCSNTAGWEDVATIANDDVHDGDLRRHLRFTARPIICRELRLSIDRSQADFSIVRYLKVIGVPV